MLITAGINLFLNMLLLKGVVSIFSERKIVLDIAQFFVIGFLALLAFLGKNSSFSRKSRISAYSYKHDMYNQRIRTLKQRNTIYWIR